MLRADDYKAGMFVMVRDENEPKTFDADQYIVRDGPPAGVPMYVKAVCLPFLAVELPGGECGCGRRHGPQTMPLDTRTVELVKVPAKYARAFDDDEEAERVSYLEHCTSSYQYLYEEAIKLFGITQPLPAKELVESMKAKVLEWQIAKQKTKG